MSMFNEKEQIILGEIKSQWLKEYQGSPKLQAQYKTFDDYAAAKCDDCFLEGDYKNSPVLQAEFGNLERYIAFMRAHKDGMANIVGSMVRRV
jgi:hypothetical protein